MSETEVTTEAQIDITDDLDAFTNDFFGQKSSEEKPDTTKQVADQDEEDQPSVDTDAQTDEEDEAELQSEVKEPPKKKTVQDRIDEVVRQREDLRRENAAELAKLRQELEDFKKSSAPVKPDVTASEPTPDALDANGNSVYALGEFDPQYIRDLTRFTLQEERTKVQAEMVEAQKVNVATQEQQILQTQWNGRVETATQEYPDFVEKGQALLNNFNNLDQGYAGYLSNVLMQMDKGTDVLYYLSQHPEEAMTIVNSGAQKATLALGRIEARFLQSEQNAPKPKITKAPPPPNVRTRGTNGAFMSVAPDTDNLDDFEAAFFAKK